MTNLKQLRKILAEDAVSSKYKPGDFGYWWTVIDGNEDIEGRVHSRDIFCSYNKLTSLKGAPKEVLSLFLSL